MPTFDFACPHGHVFEASVSRDTRSHACACGEQGTRLLSAPQLITRHVSVPRSQREVRIGQVEEAGLEVEHQWQKLEYEMDRPLKRPAYAKIAKQRAQDALAGKIPPPEGWTDPLSGG